MPPIPSTQKRILLLGAGELGTSLLTSLLPSSPSPSTPHHITLAIRSPPKYTSLLQTHASLTLKALDLSAPSSSLIPIFAEFDVIISATGFMQTPDTLLKLCNEVLEAGKLRHSTHSTPTNSTNGNGGGSNGKEKLWFFPWQFGVDYDVTGDGHGLMPLFGAQKLVRDILRESALSHHVNWTVVSTGIFMSFLFSESWGIVSHSRGKMSVTALRNWEHKVTVTHVDDIGRVVAMILDGDVDARDRVVYVAGQTVSYGELADIVGRVMGKEVKREALGIEYLEEELRKDPEDWLKKYRLVFAREGVWWDEEGTVNRKLGVEMVRVEEYARKVLVE